MVCGRNFDYSLFDYLIFVNKRNVSKTALQYDIEQVGFPATWTSKYGSITFNICGSEFATDGINESGLIVTALMLDETKFLLNDTKPSILVDQWVQYLLDNFENVPEVIEACSSIHIRYNPWEFWRLHIFVTDKTGNNAVIEFINNQIVVTTGDNLVKPVITNSTYANSINYYTRGVFTGSKTSSLNRFARAVNFLDQYKNEDLVDYSFTVLDSIKQSHTNRKIVYDLSNMRVYLKSINNSNLRYFDINSFNFNCNEAVLIYDETNSDAGNIQNLFIPYSGALNMVAIEAAWIFLKKPYSSEELAKFSTYPLSFVCSNPNTKSSSYLNSRINQLKIFPNPVNDVLYIQLDPLDEPYVNISIIDIAGNKVYNKHEKLVNPTRIQTGHFVKGEYIIILSNSKKKWYGKFFII